MKKHFFLLIAFAVLLIAFVLSCNKDTSVTGVKLDNYSLILGVGQTETLITTVSPQKAANKTVIFTSSNPIVATVMPNGLVTALTKGSATIVVTTVDGNFSASCTVKVEEISVTSVTLNKTQLTLDIDETEVLIATVLPEHATIKEVYWTISNPAVATIVNGLITPLTTGTATITVTTLDGNKTAKCDLEVIKRVHVTGVKLNKTTLNLGVGMTEKLEATVLPYYATNQNITWSSSNFAIVSVDNEGLVTAKAEGTAIITVTTEDGNYKATCEVKCINYTPPTLTTLEPSDIDIDNYWVQVTATVGGNITYVGNPAYFERGIKYSVGDPAQDESPWSPPVYTEKIFGLGIGNFTKRVTFDGYFEWHVRAYVETTVGTIYGDMVTISRWKK